MRRPTSIIPLLLFVTLAGCVTGQQDYRGNQAIDVEVSPSAPVKVSSYSLREEAGKLIVSGRVSSLNPIRMPGHVDVVVCDPEGQSAGHYQASILDHASKRGGLKQGRFFASLATIPAAGSKVKLRYDSALVGGKGPGCSLECSSH